MRANEFTPYNGVHCETNAIGTALAHQGWLLSEEMLFGLGEGLSYQHWTPEESGTPYPICSGRIPAGQIGNNLAHNCDFSLEIHETDSSEVAWDHVANALESGLIPSVRCDIYYLPYFKAKHHFSAHYIGVVAYDGKYAYVTDTVNQGNFHRITLKELAIARSSSEGYQPARNLSQNYHLPPTVPSLPERIPKSIRSCFLRYLEDDDPNSGPECIKRTAHWLQEVAQGSKESINHSSLSLGYFWRFAGTGGSNFRQLYRDFLLQSAELCPDLDLTPAIDAYSRLVESWDTVIDLLLAMERESDPKATLNEVANQLEAIAAEEYAAGAQILRTV